MENETAISSAICCDRNYVSGSPNVVAGTMLDLDYSLDKNRHLKNPK